MRCTRGEGCDYLRFSCCDAINSIDKDIASSYCERRYIREGFPHDFHRTLLISRAFLVIRRRERRQLKQEGNVKLDVDVLLAAARVVEFPIIWN